MKPVYATFALIALAVATAGFAQTAPQSQPQPEPATQPSEGKADAQSLMKDCMTRAQAANPGATQKDVKEYCIKEVTQQSNSQPAPHD